MCSTSSISRRPRGRIWSPHSAMCRLGVTQVGQHEAAEDEVERGLGERGFCDFMKVEGHFVEGGRKVVGEEVLGVVEADGVYGIQGVGHEMRGVAGAASEVCRQFRSRFYRPSHEHAGRLCEGLREQ